MNTKTERLEMRLDANTIERIDDWRTRRDDAPSRSEAVRRLIEVGLEAETPEGFRLSHAERLMTWMLSEVLKNQLTEIAGEDSKRHDLKAIDFIQNAIFGGHYWALIWDLPGVLHSHVDDPKKVRTVVNILDMWHFIENAYAGFSASDRKRIVQAVGPRGENPQFLGFDGNNETEYMGIARFLVDQMGRFAHFKGRELNSHMPTVERYRQMALIFDAIRPSLVGRLLTVDQVISLLKTT